MMDTIIRIPTLETPRLILRAPRAEDFESYAAFRASERAAHIGGPSTRAQAFMQMSALIGHWQLRGYGRWIVADKTSDEAFGVVGLFYPEDWPEPEIAWSLFAPAEGRGIAFEAAAAAREFAYRTLGWQTVVSLIAPGNARSIALARRLGAVLDGVHEHEEHGSLGIYRHPRPEQTS